MLVDGVFIRSVGGLDEQIAMYLEDVELCRRAGEAGRPVRLVLSARCGHALGGSSGEENFRASTGLHLTLLAARLEFIRRHEGRLAARVARLLILLGAATRVPLASLLRRPDLARKHRATRVWALRSGKAPDWPLQIKADAPAAASRGASHAVVDENRH
jgi:GT2 family glycosyltransferase